MAEGGVDKSTDTDDSSDSDASTTSGESDGDNGIHIQMMKGYHICMKQF